MTLGKDQLEQMGIIWNGSKVYPNRFFIPHVGDATLYEPYTIDQILNHVYKSGFENGTRHGEKMKIDQIKEILDI